jgi:predicted dehydrogenase
MVLGYTLRHHPAVQAAWKVAKSGELGPVLYLRGRYGHGGRPGYADEWRTIPDESGGGQLLDQGVHLIDLSRCFLGNFTKTMGSAKCFHWAKGRSEVEDNVFMLLETAEEKVAFLHASWTQWKNLFSLEVFLEDGSVVVEGLGGSYGKEILRIVKRQRGGGIPDIEEREFSAAQSNGLDEVWSSEWDAFIQALNLDEAESDCGNLPPATVSDGYAVLGIVQQLYESTRSDRTLKSAS